MSSDTYINHGEGVIVGRSDHVIVTQNASESESFDYDAFIIQLQKLEEAYTAKESTDTFGIQTIRDAIDAVRKNDYSKAKNCLNKLSNYALGLAKQLSLNLIAIFLTRQ